MRPAIGVVSTTCASVVFHTAPNVAEPSWVIRLTERDGTSDGGISGAGGGGAAGGRASAVDETTAGMAASAGPTKRLRRIVPCIVFLPCFDGRAWNAKQRATVTQG